MHFTPENVYHIYNRGNNKQPIFFNDKNYDFFLHKINKQLSPISEMLCWCLMPNHFHLMVYATEKSCRERSSFGGKPMQEFAYQLGVLLSSYSQAINKQNGTTGSLFQQKTKAKIVSCGGVKSGLNGNYLNTCTHYIHQNPWKAGLAEKLEDWRYSSFNQYINNGFYKTCNCDLLLSLAGYDVSTFYKNSYAVLDKEEVEAIW